jgi:hypothetical protein
MDEVFRVESPPDRFLDDVRRVLGEQWPLDESMTQPHVVLDRSSRAYGVELDRTEIEEAPLYFEDAEEPHRRRRGHVHMRPAPGTAPPGHRHSITR